MPSSTANKAVPMSEYSMSSIVHHIEGRTYMASVSPRFSFAVSGGTLMPLGLFNILYLSTVLILVAKKNLPRGRLAVCETLGPAHPKPLISCQ